MQNLRKELRAKRPAKEFDHRQTRSRVQSAGRQKCALILAVSEYVHQKPLRSAISDARTLQGTLMKQDGWSVEPVLNRGLETTEKMKKTIENLANDHGDDDVMFVFIGHGVEVNGRNYLVTANSKIGFYPDEAAYEQAVKLECLAFEDVKRVFKDARDASAGGSSAAPPAIVFLLDNCRVTGNGFARNSSADLAANAARFAELLRSKPSPVTRHLSSRNTVTGGAAELPRAPRASLNTLLTSSNARHSSLTACSYAASSG